MPGATAHSSDTCEARGGLGQCDRVSLKEKVAKMQSDQESFFCLLWLAQCAKGGKQKERESKKEVLDRSCCPSGLWQREKIILREIL